MPYYRPRRYSSKQDRVPPIMELVWETTNIVCQNGVSGREKHIPQLRGTRNVRQGILLLYARMVIREDLIRKVKE